MQDHSSIASCNRCISASMHVIDALGELEKRVVITMDGVNAENAGAIFCHLRDFPGLPGAPRACVDFSDPTDVSRFIVGKPSSTYH